MDGLRVIRSQRHCTDSAILKGMYDEERSSFLLTSAAMVVLLWEKKGKKGKRKTENAQLSWLFMIIGNWENGHDDLE